jgi:transposase-like protein
VCYLPKSHQAIWRRRLQWAYEKPTCEESETALNHLKPELKLLHESALAIFEKELEKTVSVYRLSLFTQLGVSVKTYNCIESVMSLVGQDTDKVDCWKNSSQKHRWIASSLLEIQSRLPRIKGYRYLPSLRLAFKQRFQFVKEAA